MKTLFLLLLICSASGISAQKISEDNRSIYVNDIENLNSYSVILSFNDGQTFPFPQSRNFLEMIFPQLKAKKLVRKDPSFIINVMVDPPLEYQHARQHDSYSEEAVRYFFMEANHMQTFPGNYQYFQPVTISYQIKDSSHYQLFTLGRLFTRNLANVRDRKSEGEIPVGLTSTWYWYTIKNYFPEREVERRNALENLDFIRIHLPEILNIRK